MANFVDLFNTTITGGFTLAVQAEESNMSLMNTRTMRAIMARVDRYARAIRYGNGAATRISLLPLRDAVMAATAEGSDPGATTFTPTNRDLATARNAILFSIGDNEVARIDPAIREAFMVLQNMRLDRAPDAAEMAALSVFGQLGYYAFANRLAALLKLLASAWGTHTFGGTGTDPTYSEVAGERDALADAGNRGVGLWMTTRPHLTHFRDNLISLGGAVQSSDTAARSVDPGVVTVIENIVSGIDAAVVPGMPTSGGDTYNQMFFPEGVTVKVETPKLQSDAIKIGQIGPGDYPLATIEKRRIAGSTSVISIVSWLGLGVLDDNAGSKGLFDT